MTKVVEAKYLSVCDSCGKKCTHLIRAGRKYLHVCTSCLLNTFVECENALGKDCIETRGKCKEAEHASNK